MCCSPSKPVEHLVNTDGAPFHTLEPDLANERKVEEVTFALNPYTRHRNISPSAGEKTDTSLPHNIMQKLDRFDFLLSHSTCYLTHPPLLSATMGFPKYSFLNSCSYLCWAPCLFYTHHLLHCFIAVLMRGISFFNQSGIFRIILLTHQHCLWCTFCYSSKQAPSYTIYRCFTSVRSPEGGARVYLHSKMCWTACSTHFWFTVMGV